MNTVAQWIVAGLFLLAAFGKVIGFRRFATVAADFAFLPKRASVPLALMLILTEFTIGVGVLVESIRVFFSLFGAWLLICFGALIAANLLFERRFSDCACFGGSTGLNWGQVARNIGFAGLCLVHITTVGWWITLFGAVLFVPLLRYPQIQPLPAASSRNS
jgi:hypothetical protein